MDCFYPNSRFFLLTCGLLLACIPTGLQAQELLLDLQAEQAWNQDKADRPLDSLSRIRQAWIVGHHELLLEFGGARQAFQDDYLSPLAYRGTGLWGGGAYRWSTASLITQFKFGVHYSPDLQSDLPPPLAFNSAEAVEAVLSASWQRRVWRRKLKHVDLWAGPALYANLDYRFHNQYSNNARSYGLYTGLAGATTLAWPFTLFKRNWQLLWQQELPLLGWVHRPPFSANLHPGIGAENVYDGFFERGELAAWHNTFAWNHDLQLQYILKSGNSVYLAYGWTFLHTSGGDTGNTLSRGAHRLSFGLNFCLACDNGY